MYRLAMIFLIIWLQSLSTKLANQALHGGGSQGSALATRCERHVVVRDVLRETAACSTDPSAILQQIFTGRLLGTRCCWAQGFNDGKGD